MSAVSVSPSNLKVEVVGNDVENGNNFHDLTATLQLEGEEVQVKGHCCICLGSGQNFLVVDPVVIQGQTRKVEPRSFLYGLGPFPYERAKRDLRGAINSLSPS